MWYLCVVFNTCLNRRVFYLLVLCSLSVSGTTGVTITHTPTCCGYTTFAPSCFTWSTGTQVGGGSRRYGRSSLVFMTASSSTALPLMFCNTAPCFSSGTDHINDEDIHRSALCLKSGAVLVPELVCKYGYCHVLHVTLQRKWPCLDLYVNSYSCVSDAFECTHSFSSHTVRSCCNLCFVYFLLCL